MSDEHDAEVVEEAATPLEATEPPEVVVEPKPAIPHIAGRAAAPVRINMPLRVCSTCRATGVVSHGGRLYVCPACKGSRGQKLGQPAPEAAAADEANDGRSKAARYLSGRFPARRR